MIIVDNFITEKSFLNELRKDEYWECPLKYSWKDKESDNKNIWEVLASTIWHNAMLDFEYSGYEYWTNTFKIGNQTELDWHYDKDEAYWKNKNKIITPKIGCVWYAHTEIPDGGFLEINREGDLERIQPVPNRLIIFDPETPHRVVSITSGVRRTFASNIWIEKPLEENFV